MAAETKTAVMALADAIADPNMKVLGEAKLTGFILSHISAEQTYTATLVTAGYWVVLSPQPLVLFNPTFDASTGEHTLNAAGGGGYDPVVSLKLTGGTDTRGEIEITGAPVVWGLLVAEVMTHIANNRAIAYSQSVGGGSVSPETSRRELLRQADVYRGVIGF